MTNPTCRGIVTVLMAIVLGAVVGSARGQEKKDERGVIRDASGTLMRGVVTQIAETPPDSIFVLHLLLDADPAKPDRRNQTRVNLDAKAVIKVVAGKETKEAKVADLKKGQNVQLVKVGGVLYSLPPTAHALEILILDGDPPPGEAKPDLEMKRTQERLVGSWRRTEGEHWWIAVFERDGGYLLREHHDGAGGREGFVREKGKYRVLDAGAIEIVLDGKAVKRTVRFADPDVLNYSKFEWMKR